MSRNTRAQELAARRARESAAAANAQAEIDAAKARANTHQLPAGDVDTYGEVESTPSNWTPPASAIAQTAEKQQAVYGPPLPTRAQQAAAFATADAASLNPADIQAQQAAAFAAANNTSVQEYIESQQSSGGMNQMQGPSAPSASQGQIDKRVRIRCKPGKEETVYGPAGDPSNPLAILYETGGLVFPYTPTITYQQNPSWQTQELTHFIQQYYYFTATESAQITINGKFTIQNAREGRYLLGAFHFLRSYSKMNFGLQEPETTRGLPPPVLILDGYGAHVFNTLPIIIRSWNMDFPDNVDYIKVFTSSNEGKQNSTVSTGNTAGPGHAYLPSITNITINAVVQQPPTKLKNQFNLAEFRNGNLLRSGGFT